MRNPGGYGILNSPVPTSVWFDEERRDVEYVRAGTFETDTFSCGHCGRVTRVKPKMDAADMGGLCKCCMKLVCNHCVGKGCDTLEAKLERAYRRERLYQAARER